jgi:hypothetical protein
VSSISFIDTVPIRDWYRYDDVVKYDILIIAVKVLNTDGFLITVYQTKGYTKKGELVWQKQKEQ